MLASLAHVFEQVSFFDDGQHLEGRGANQGSASEGGAVHSRRKCGRKLLVRDNRAKRQSTRQRFGNRYGIGSRREPLIREISAGTAEAALNFVRDHRSVVLRSQRARTIPEFFADRENPAFTLNRFQNDGADGIVEFTFEVGDIIELHKFHARYQRSERLAIFFGISNRNRAKSSSMERIL